MRRVRALTEWMKARLGIGAETSPVEPAYKCAVCGTPVRDPSGSCPLCRSSELMVQDEADDREPEDAGGLQGGTPRQTAVADDPRTVGDVLGADGDLLAAYADRWESVGGRYRVSLPDGTQRAVDSKDDVRVTLFDHYGPPEE